VRNGWSSSLLLPQTLGLSLSSEIDGGELQSHARYRIVNRAGSQFTSKAEQEEALSAVAVNYDGPHSVALERTGLAFMQGI
jgi:hypothetical protein